jgi:hypothetical protein
MEEEVLNTEPETGSGTEPETGTNTGTGTGTGTEPEPSTSTSIINQAVESVMDLIDAMGNFSDITRGALGTTPSLTCEISPYTPLTVFMDKNTYHALTLAINGKHSGLQTLSDTLNNIVDTLTRRKEYPYGNGWEIVDITPGMMPRIIGREDNSDWLMACDISIKIYRKDEELV